MPRVWDSRLDALGVRVVSPAGAQVSLVQGRWQDASQAGDKFNIFVRVQDENGQPQPDQAFRVRFTTDTAETRIERTKGPGLDDFYGNFAMFPGLVYTVDIPGITSEQVTGLVRGVPGNPAANSSFFLVFQRGAPATPPPPPPPPDDGPPKLDDMTRQRLLALLDQAQAEIDAARALLEGHS